MRQKCTLVSSLLVGLTLSLYGQQPFYAETFDQGWPAGWSTTDISENDANKKLHWALCSQPQQYPPSSCAPSRFPYFQEAFPDAIFGANSAVDGYVYADSDSALINTGLPHISQLNAAPIDCQAYSEVFLQFESHLAYQEATPDTNAILLAGVDGISWDTFQLFPSLDLDPDLDIVFTLNPVRITVDLTATAAGQATLYLRWQWRGFQELCWALDDVKLFAENPAHYRAVWGQLPGEGDFDGGLNGWEVVPDDPLNGWKWENQGQLGTGLLTPDGFYLSSPSQFNGMMTFNADLYSTGGEPPVPLPLPIYDSELWSPVIDLSGTDAPLSLRFAQLFRPFNPAPGSCPTVSAIAFSYDGGDSWSDCIDTNPGPVIPDFWNDSTRILPLPEAATGAAEFRLKFIFNGTLFGWAIDDVVIFERPENDLRLDGRYFAKAPNLQTPKTLIDSLYFLADAANVGQDTQYNVRVYIEVAQADGPQYFLDSILIDTIAPGALVENLFFERAFLPSSEVVGRFKCRYFIQGENVDQDPSNNTLYWEFAVTENTLAKELRPTAAFAPAGQQNYRYGNCYYIPEDAENLFATTFTFGVGNVPPGILEQVGTYLYEVEGDVNENFEFEPAEYDQKGINSFNFSASENYDLVTIPINFDEEPVPLKPGHYYMAVAEFSPVADYTPAMLVSERDDFLATFITYLTEVEQIQYFSVLALGNNQTFSVQGLGNTGFGQIPVARLGIEQGVAVESRPQDSMLWQVFPNPTAGLTQLRFTGPSTPEEYEWELFTADGRLIQKALQESRATTLAMDLSHLPAGTYLIRIQTAEQVWSSPILKK